ncbi:MAG: OsmY domain-containing protein [Burkholderiales bacterium PBB4]|nr:MAG: OsmY domain-containing protein [Burkholderiales bacterium PBB4]
MKTDSQLQRDVMAELKWEPSVHAEQIGVEAKDGVVTLTGHVSSYLEKFHAEEAAQRVEGVMALAIEMDVKLSQLGMRNDEDIARSAETALEWMGAPASKTVKVIVEKGWVTLSGTVDWQYQRQATENGIRYLVGVTGVSNQVVVKPAVTLAAVKHEIEAALARRSKVDAQKVTVNVHGSAVTLTGAVNSLSERNAARESAWGAPGVMSVDDKMTVAA